MANRDLKLARHVHHSITIGHYQKSMKTSKDQKYREMIKHGNK